MNWTRALTSRLNLENFSEAKAIDTHGKRAINIFVPMPPLRAYQKIPTYLVQNLEKKFSGRHVVFIAQRKVLSKSNRKIKNKQKEKRPVSQTLTSVHEVTLEDLYFAAEIVAKRIRIKAHGSKLIKVH